MKRNIDNQISYDSNTVFEGYDAKISESDMDKLWDLLQDPYKNPIGAVVREYVSNSFDSHAEAAFIRDNSIEDIRKEYSIYNDYSDEYVVELKQHMEKFEDDAVKVSIEKDDSGWFWAAEDFGIGLSPERVKDVFCSYLKSTKEDTNNLIGAFGIGSKSGLSYTDIIYIRTRYNGTEYQYMLRKGEKSPRLDKIIETGTTEKNGTQIKLYIKSRKKYSWANSEPEIDRFQDECKKQLAYFDNVYFAGRLDIPNEYKIIEGDNWKLSSQSSPFSGLHMCLGKVAYPIDWDALGLEKIELPLALKFDIGELDIIQTREDVKYTPRTVESIHNKITSLKEELKRRWEEDNDYLTNDFKLYLQERHNSPELHFSVDNFDFILQLKQIFKTKEIPSYAYKPFVDIGFNGNDVIVDSFFIDYIVPSYVNDSGLKHRREVPWYCLRTDKPLYRIEGSHDSKKSKYIYSEVENTVYYFLRKDGKPSLKHYKRNWALEYYPKSEWRTIISTIQKAVLNTLKDHSKSYKAVQIDKQWLKEQRKPKAIIDKTKFNLYELTYLYSYSGSFRPKKLEKAKIINDTRSLYIIGLKEDSKWLEFMYGIFNNLFRQSTKQHLKLGYIAPSNVKHIKDVKNLINPLNYMEHKVFKKACTVIYLKTHPKYKDSIHLDYDRNNILDSLKDVNPELYKKYKEVLSYYSYAKKALDRHYGFQPSYDENDNIIERENNFMDSVYKYTVENNLLDDSIIKSAEEVKEYFDNIPLIKILANLRYEVPYTSDDLAQAIYRFNKSVPKQYRKKLNANYYVNLNEQEQSWLSKEDKKKYDKIKLPI